MATLRHNAEKIVAKLDQVDVLMAQGKQAADAIRTIGVTEVNFVMDCPTVRSSYSLKGAKIMVEVWRRHYNSIRPHSSFGYLPSAPEAIFWPADRRPGRPVAQTARLN